MEELDRINIQTTSSEGQNLQTVVNNGPINLTTQVSDVPQIQTILQDNISPITSVINNPFVEVTSVNGMTGDVITEAEIFSFIPHKFYKQNTLISYDGNLYWAKQDFTSGNSFVRSNWNLIEATGVSEWNDIQNKPNFATVATSGSYNDLLNQPSINDGSLTIKRNNELLGTFTANSSADTDINITVPTKTSELTNNSGFITTLPIATTTSTGVIQVGNGLEIDTNGLLKTKIQAVDETTVTPLAPMVSTNMINDSAVTTIKVADNAITKDKIDWNNIINNGSNGEYLLTKNGTDISFKPISYRIGETLVVSQNVAELYWSGTTCEIWVGGAWTQYGKMKTTSRPHILQIKNPTTSTWRVKVSMSCPTVDVPNNCYIESGLCIITLPSTITTRITQTIVSNNGGSTNIWTSYGNEKIITIPSNGSANIGAFVRTSSANKATWKGGDTISGTGSDINFGGPSCVLTATLVGID